MFRNLERKYIQTMCFGRKYFFKKTYVFKFIQMANYCKNDRIILLRIIYI